MFCACQTTDSPHTVLSSTFRVSPKDLFFLVRNTNPFLKPLLTPKQSFTPQTAIDTGMYILLKQKETKIQIQQKKY